MIVIFFQSGYFAYVIIIIFLNAILFIKQTGSAVQSPSAVEGEKENRDVNGQIPVLENGLPTTLPEEDDVLEWEDHIPVFVPPPFRVARPDLHPRLVTAKLTHGDDVIESIEQSNACSIM